MKSTAFCDSSAITTAIADKKMTAESIIRNHLSRIEQDNKQINAFTCTLNKRAIITAKNIDSELEQGRKLKPLEGVPFAVKNLFDIKGKVTLAGSKINADNIEAKEDALLIKRMENAGAVLIGSLSMGEYAYDFTGENYHYGNCANPWNLDHMSGGSSSGSGAATATGLAPVSLGSDTNGSIRVPASFCGIYGLKPTYDRLPRTGTYPFCDSLDHLGPLARSVRDISLSYEAMTNSVNKEGGEPSITKSLTQPLPKLKIKRAVGYFSCEQFPQAQAAINKICKALDVTETAELTGALEGRSAAYLITNVEGSALHKTRLQTRPDDFDPDTRDRFLAGALIPAEWYIRAQQVRKWYCQKALELFKDTDIILCPATPCTAPKIGQKTLVINGQEQLLRPNLGYFTQPISAIGLPSIVVPTIDDNNGLPIGVQLIAAPWREDLCIRLAHHLENNGFSAPIPQTFNF